MKKLFVFILLFITCACLGQKTSFAQGVNIIKKMPGMWVLPDCAYPENAVFYSKKFKLSISESTVSLEKIETIDKKNDFALVTTDKETLPVKISNDGVLSIMKPFDTRRNFKNWKNIPLTQENQYLGCYEIDNSPFMRLKTVFESIDGIIDACGTEGENCGKTVFNMLDTNKDQQVSRDEAHNALEMLFLTSKLNRSAKPEHLTSATTYTDAHGLKFTTALFTERDKDQSGGLDYAEISDILLYPPSYIAINDFLQAVALTKMNFGL